VRPGTTEFRGSRCRPVKARCRPEAGRRIGRGGGFGETGVMRDVGSGVRDNLENPTRRRRAGYGYRGELQDLERPGRRLPRPERRGRHGAREQEGRG
jgi:hypothetical protein